MFSDLKKKEIPEELICVENVIYTRENLEIESNKFLIAEKNSIPYHVDIRENNLMRANNNRVCFFDVEESLKQTPRGVENRVEEKRYKFSVLGGVKYLSNLLGLDRLKRFFILEPDGFSKLSNVEIKQKEIKKMSVNSLGQVIAILYKHNLFILVNLENQGKLILILVSKIINPKISNLHEIIYKHGEIVDLSWHGVEKDILGLAFKDKICLYKVSNDLDATFYRQIELDDITKIKWSFCGEYSIVIYNKGKSIKLYDSLFKEIYSKTQLFNSYLDIEWSPNSKFFVLYSSDNSVHLFNIINMSFKSWTEFQGNVNSIIISEKSNFVFIFTDDIQSPIYTLYNMIEDIYSTSIYDNFNNISQYYLQTEFKMNYKIFSLFTSKDKKVVKAKLNALNNRLLVMYKDSNTYKFELKIFEVNLEKSVHDIKLNLICTMNNFREMQATDFQLYFNYFRKTDLLVTLWDEKYLSLTYLNANDLIISNK